MKTISVKLVRVYVMESSGLLTKIMRYLKEDVKIHGFTVFRGISGFGESGDHNVSFLDLSMDLPLVIEFFDTEEKIIKSLEYLETFITKEHLVIMDAKANI